MDVCDESRILFEDEHSFNTSLDTTVTEIESLFPGTEGNERYEKLFELNLKLVNEMKRLWSTIHVLKNSVTKVNNEKSQLEAQLNDLNAYNRRQNIEIRNIPENVHDKDLEAHVIDILASLQIYVSAYDIVGVHRLGKFVRGKNRSVIIRFVNRKNAYAALNYQKHLKFTKYKKLFVTENLCPTYRNVFNVLYKGKKNDDIYDVWSYNGIVYAKMVEEDRPSRINTVTDLIYS